MPSGRWPHTATEGKSTQNQRAVSLFNYIGVLPSQTPLTPCAFASHQAAFIDTEGTFRPEIVKDIAERFGLDPEVTKGSEFPGISRTKISKHVGTCPKSVKRVESCPDIFRQVLEVMRVLLAPTAPTLLLSLLPQ